jgi:hypothetical protein
MTEAITEVRALLAESSAAFWSDTQLQSWINQGCEDVARRAEILWEQENITVVPLTAIYSFSNDFLNCHRAQFALDNSDQIYNMEYHAYNGMSSGAFSRISPPPGRSGSPSGAIPFRAST